MKTVALLPQDRTILDLCGGTGAWSKPYADAGYDVRVVTLPGSDLLDEAVVRRCVDTKPYGILFAVDCTLWCAAAARWWKTRTPDDIYYYSRLLVKGLRVIMETAPKFWAIENPTGKMRGFLGDPGFKFDPCDFGDPHTKKTYLWGKFHLPVKNRVEPTRTNFILNMPGGPDRKKRRSITPSGFAKAFFEANP